MKILFFRPTYSLLILILFWSISSDITYGCEDVLENRPCNDGDICTINDMAVIAITDAETELNIFEGEGFNIEEFIDNPEPSISSIDVDAFEQDALFLDESHLQLSIDMDYPWAGDLIIQLMNPCGTVVNLIDRPGTPEQVWGNPGDLSGTYAFSSDAEELFPEQGINNVIIPNDTYLPLSSFSGFFGCELNGEWTLLINDVVLGGNGFVADWSLELTHDPGITICEPCTGELVNDCEFSPTEVQACDDGDPCTINDQETILACDGTVCIPCSGESYAFETEVGDIICNNATTLDDPSDDFFAFFLTVTGANLSDSWVTTDGQYSGPYDTAIILGGFMIADGEVALELVDSENTDCLTTLIVQPPQTCSNGCLMEATVFEETCHDQGTPDDPSDDTFSFMATVDNLNFSGDGWLADDGTTGSYEEASSFGPYPISQSTVSIEFYDNTLENCSSVINFEFPNICSAPIYEELEFDFQVAYCIGTAPATAWIHDDVVLMIEGETPGDRDPEIMEQALEILADVINQFEDFTGLTDLPMASSYQGKPVIEIVIDNCGAGGLANHGTLGMSTGTFFLDQFYTNLQNNNLAVPQIFLYELNRNFWDPDFNNKFDWAMNDEPLNYGWWTVGMNNAQSVIIPQSLGIEMDYFGNDLSYFRNRMVGELEAYMNDTQYDFDNGWRQALMPWNNTESINDMMSGFFIYSYENFGGEEWMRNFYREIKSDVYPDRTDVFAYQECRDNIYKIWSVSANEDLISFFENDMRWIISVEAKTFIEDHFFVDSGIDDLTLNQTINIYPNPVSDGLMQVILSDDLQGQSISILSIDGKRKMLVADSFEENQISVDGLEPGIYLLQVGDQRLKFVVQ